MENHFKYENQGEVITIGDLEMYVVGEGPNAIIWNYDVYGFDEGIDFRTIPYLWSLSLESELVWKKPISGRTRQYCDFFAVNGFRGEVWPVDEGIVSKNFPITLSLKAGAKKL